MNLLVIILISYILGSIPTSIIISRLWKGIDIRDYGSGNAGFTNVVRVLGWKPGIVVAIIDILKGYITAVYISKIGFNSISLDYSLIQIIAGFSAITGHIWTIFARFKGGKGVLTALGMVIGLIPSAAIICVIIWGVIVYKWRYVSLGSITAGVVFPIIVSLEKYYLNSNISLYLLLFSFIMCILIIHTHRTNISRLLNGTENKFGSKILEP